MIDEHTPQNEAAVHDLAVIGGGVVGIVWSALAGELLADQMEDSPWRLDRNLAEKLAEKLAPARFLR